jgi:lipoyl(octanoyl) transferase
LNNLLPKNKWLVIDSGSLSGEANMALDRAALDKAQSDPASPPTLRFFEWSEPTVTYGYLLKSEHVREWAKPYGKAPLVKRPSGGGAVFHSTSDLSVSLVWPKALGIFPENPRDCYAALHQIFSKTLAEMNVTTELWDATCGAVTRKKEVPVCFEEPVCHDIMKGKEKVMGGALRITKSAILYQGTIQWASLNKKEFKTSVGLSFSELSQPLLAGPNS